MKKILFLFFLLITISCNNNSNSEKIVDRFLKDIKTSNFSRAKKYILTPELLESAEFETTKEAKKIFIIALLANLEYEVQNKTTREDKSEVVNVKITNIDVEKVFTMAYKKMFKKSIEGDLNIEVKEILTEILSSSNLPKRTTISQFLIVKDNKEKKILLRKTNIDDLLGGYFSTSFNDN